VELALPHQTASAAPGRNTPQAGATNPHNRRALRGFATGLRMNEGGYIPHTPLVTQQVNAGNRELWSTSLDCRPIRPGCAKAHGATTQWTQAMSLAGGKAHATTADQSPCGLHNVTVKKARLQPANSYANASREQWA
jgi:hypothetical protein